MGGVNTPEASWASEEYGSQTLVGLARTQQGEPFPGRPKKERAAKATESSPM